MIIPLSCVTPLSPSLTPPPLPLSPSAFEDEDSGRGRGERRDVDVDSLDLSFDSSPPDSPVRTGRRNTAVFTLAPNSIFTLLPSTDGIYSEMSTTGLPISVQYLRTMVNTPMDAVEEEKRAMVRY